MLNYIWLGLLFLGIGTALTLDLSNQTQNKYRNGESVDVTISFDSSFTKSYKPFDAIIKISAQSFGKFYSENQKEEINQKVKLTFNKKENNYVAYFIIDEKSPAIWQEMAKVSGKENDLGGKIVLISSSGINSFSAAFT